MEEALMQIMNVSTFQQLVHQIEVSLWTQSAPVQTHVSSASAVLSLSLATRTSLFSYVQNPFRSIRMLVTVSP